MLVDPDGRAMGNPQALKQAGVNAVNYVIYKYGQNQAACNIGVEHAYRNLTGDNSLKGLEATDMITKIQNSDRFKEIDKSQVFEYANQGDIVIIGKQRSAGENQSHVVMGMPGEPDNGWPIVMDTGANKRSTEKGINWSWRKNNRNNIKYYLYTGEMSEKRDLATPAMKINLPVFEKIKSKNTVYQRITKVDVQTVNVKDEFK